MILRLTLGIVLALWTSGCALYYVDSRGATHVYGFGHLAMKAVAPSEGRKAILEEMTLYGVAAGIRDGQPSLSIGIDQQRRMVVLDENTSVRVDWPDDHFFGIQVGSNPMPLDEPAGFVSSSPEDI